MARLNDAYVKDIAPAMMKKFGYKSVMQIPKLEKVVINVGCGEARDNSKMIDAIVGDLTAITGQRPVVCKAKKSVANFKLREGMDIGAKVTLRAERMYEFVDRLFNVCLLYTSRCVSETGFLICVERRCMISTRLNSNTSGNAKRRSTHCRCEGQSPGFPPCQILPPMLK